MSAFQRHWNCPHHLSAAAAAAALPVVLLQSGSLHGLIRRLLLLEAVRETDSSGSAISALLTPALRRSWQQQQQQQLNLGQLTGMRNPSSSSRGESIGDDSESALERRGKFASSWFWNDLIHFLLMLSFKQSTSNLCPDSAGFAADNKLSRSCSGTNNARLTAAVEVAAEAAFARAGPIQGAALQQHLRCCFGPQSCTALTAWVLLWHCCVEEAGGDYGSAKTR